MVRRRSIPSLPPTTYVLHCLINRGEVAIASTTITIKLEREEKALISDYAAAFGISVSEFIRRVALERIEDELDLQAWEEAKAEFEADPETLSSAEIAKKYL